MPNLHSSKNKALAIRLRKQGFSLRNIAKKLKIALSTAQLWTKEVVLSEKQKQKIVREHREKLVLGQIKFNKKRKAHKTKSESEIFSAAKKKISHKVSDSFFILGLALYWAEGFKKDHALGFVNSDPTMVVFFLKWLKTYGKINLEDVRLRVQIHHIYKPNINTIQLYWSELLKIPISQFQSSFYQVSKSKPSLVDPQYKGLLRIRVIKTRTLFIKILGWLEGLKEIQ